MQESWNLRRTEFTKCVKYTCGAKLGRRVFVHCLPRVTVGAPCGLCDFHRNVSLQLVKEVVFLRGVCMAGSMFVEGSGTFTDSASDRMEQVARTEPWAASAVLASHARYFVSCFFFFFCLFLQSRLANLWMGCFQDVTKKERSCGIRVAL